MFIPRPKQQEVLSYRSGKMGVSAVPGSGKTETLSRLAAQIIDGGLLGSQQEVLVVTLVNSAVDNFYQRISRLVKEEGLLPHVGYRVRTLHGLAHDIVRERPGLVGLSERFDIVDERMAEEILDEAAVAWLRSHPYALDDYLAPGLEGSKQDWVRREQLPELVKETAFAFTALAKDRQLSPEQLRSLLDGLVVPLPLAEMGAAIYADYQRGLAYRGSGLRRPDPASAAGAAAGRQAAGPAAPALALHPGGRGPGQQPAAGGDPAPAGGRGGQLGAGGRPQPGHLRDLHTASPEYLRRFLKEEAWCARSAQLGPLHRQHHRPGQLSGGLEPATAPGGGGARCAGAHPHRAHAPGRPPAQPADDPPRCF